MPSTRKIICVFLVTAIFLISAVGCGEDSTATKRKKKKVIIVKRNQTSDVSQTEDQNSGQSDLVYNDADTEKYISDRQLAEKESDSKIGNSYVPEYKVKAVKWNAPNGYHVVYPYGNEQLRQAANKLAAYFKQNGVEVTAVSDRTGSGDKEILVGDTNRRKSKLKENQYAVCLDGSRLCFESGNFNGVVKAVSWFISFPFTAGKINTLTGAYSFSSAVIRPDGNYKYVWGDEFDGNFLDGSKWELTTHMSAGDSSFKLSRDPKVISVSEGNLKLSAQRWFDPDNNQVQAVAPYTLEGKKHVNFQYGYIEMRAILPLQNGAWPSLWFSGACTTGSGAVVSSIFDNGDIYKADFTAEFDIVEYVTLAPNLHKWFFNGEHSSLGAVEKPKVHPMYLDSSQMNIYHIIGCDWTPEELTIYIDGEKFYTYNWKNSVQLDESNDMTDFLNPVFIRLNNHLIPKNIPSDYSTLPCEYFVDYIRIYQKPGVGGLWLAE